MDGGFERNTLTNEGDEAAIREIYRRLMEGWNRGGGEAFAAVFDDDGDQVAFDGTRFEGRREISTSHQELFDDWMKGTRLVGRIESVKFPIPDVAIAHARGGTVMRGRSEPSSERDSIQTLVAVRRDGEWRLAALDNIQVRMEASAAKVSTLCLSLFATPYAPLPGAERQMACREIRTYV